MVFLAILQILSRSHQVICSWRKALWAKRCRWQEDCASVFTTRKKAQSLKLLLLRNFVLKFRLTQNITPSHRPLSKKDGDFLFKC